MIKELKHDPQEELMDAIMITKLNELIRDYNKRVGDEGGT